MATAANAIRMALCIDARAPDSTPLPEPLARAMLGTSVERLSPTQLTRLAANSFTIADVISLHELAQWAPLARVASQDAVDDEMAAAALQIMIRPNSALTRGMQSALRRSGFPVRVDGIMGPKTLQAMAGIMPEPQRASLPRPVQVAVDETDIIQAIYNYCRAAGMKADAIAMCIAHATAESNLNWQLEESSAYRSASRIRLVFGSARTRAYSDSELMRMAGTPMLFEAMYGYQTAVGRGMGNTKSGDGGRYFGRGLLQLTGFENYQKAGAYLGVDLVKHPELVVTDLQVALGCVVYAWSYIMNPTGKVISFMETYERLSGGTVNNHSQRQESYRIREEAYRNATTRIAGMQSTTFV